MLIHWRLEARYIMKLTHCITVTLALVATAAAAAPPPAFLVGDWTLETQTDPHMDGQRTRSILTLDMRDGALSGTLTARDVEKPLKDITYMDGTLRFTISTCATARCPAR